MGGVIFWGEGDKKKDEAAWAPMCWVTRSATVCPTKTYCLFIGRKVFYLCCSHGVAHEWSYDNAAGLTVAAPQASNRAGAQKSLLTSAYVCSMVARGAEYGMTFFRLSESRRRRASVQLRPPKKEVSELLKPALPRHRWGRDKREGKGAYLPSQHRWTGGRDCWAIRKKEEEEEEKGHLKGKGILSVLWKTWLWCRCTHPLPSTAGRRTSTWTSTYQRVSRGEINTPTH